MALKSANIFSETIEVERIGTVHVQHSTKVKYVRIRLHPEKGVVLVIPAGVSKDAAMQFLVSKRAWIQKKTDQMKDRDLMRTLFSTETNFTTHLHSLELKQHTKNSLRCEVKHGKISVWYPAHVSVEHEKVQAFIRRTVEGTWRLEAKKMVPVWVKELADKHGFSYNDIRIKNTKTRWGSCSSKKNLNFSLHIMRLPEALRTYLLLHELVHTKEPNHGKGFWQTLERCLPDAKRLDKELNSYHIEIW